MLSWVMNDGCELLVLGSEKLSLLSEELSSSSTTTAYHQSCTWLIVRDGLMYLLNVSSSHILYLENDELTEQSDDAQCILIYDISMDTGVMVNLNVVPLPFSDVKLMCPPNHSIIHLVIVRPKPLPFLFKCWLLYTWLKILNKPAASC